MHGGLLLNSSARLGAIKYFVMPRHSHAQRSCYHSSGWRCVWREGVPYMCGKSKYPFSFVSFIIHSVDELLQHIVQFIYRNVDAWVLIQCLCLTVSSYNKPNHC